MTVKARTPEQYNRLLAKALSVTASYIISLFPFSFRTDSEEMADHITQSATFLVTRNHKSLLRRFGQSTRERQADSRIATLDVYTKHIQRESKVREPIDIAEQNIAKHSPHPECGDAIIPVHPVESRLLEILSDIRFHVKDALARLLTDTLSSANK